MDQWVLYRETRKRHGIIDSVCPPTDQSDQNDAAVEATLNRLKEERRHQDSEPQTEHCGSSVFIKEKGQPCRFLGQSENSNSSFLSTELSFTESQSENFRAVFVSTDVTDPSSSLREGECKSCGEREAKTKAQPVVTINIFTEPKKDIKILPEITDPVLTQSQRTDCKSSAGTEPSVVSLTGSNNLKEGITESPVLPDTVVDSLKESQSEDFGSRHTFETAEASFSETQRSEVVGSCTTVKASEATFSELQSENPKPSQFPKITESSSSELGSENSTLSAFVGAVESSLTLSEPQSENILFVSSANTDSSYSEPRIEKSSPVPSLQDDETKFAEAENEENQIATHTSSEKADKINPIEPLCENTSSSELTVESSFTESQREIHSSPSPLESVEFSLNNISDESVEAVELSFTKLPNKSIPSVLPETVEIRSIQTESENNSSVEFVADTVSPESSFREPQIDDILSASETEDLSFTELHIKNNRSSTPEKSTERSFHHPQIEENISVVYPDSVEPSFVEVESENIKSFVQLQTIDDRLSALHSENNSSASVKQTSVLESIFIESQSEKHISSISVIQETDEPSVTELQSEELSSPVTLRTTEPQSENQSSFETDLKEPESGPVEEKDSSSNDSNMTSHSASQYNSCQVFAPPSVKSSSGGQSEEEEDNGELSIGQLVSGDDMNESLNSSNNSNHGNKSPGEVSRRQVKPILKDKSQFKSGPEVYHEMNRLADADYSLESSPRSPHVVSFQNNVKEFKPRQLSYQNHGSDSGQQGVVEVTATDQMDSGILSAASMPQHICHEETANPSVDIESRKLTGALSSQHLSLQHSDKTISEPNTTSENFFVPKSFSFEHSVTSLPDGATEQVGGAISPVVKKYEDQGSSSPESVVPPSPGSYQGYSSDKTQKKDHVANSRHIYSREKVKPEMGGISAWGQKLRIQSADNQVDFQPDITEVKKTLFQHSDVSSTSSPQSQKDNQSDTESLVSPALQRISVPPVGASSSEQSASNQLYFGLNDQMPFSTTQFPSSGENPNFAKENKPRCGVKTFAAAVTAGDPEVSQPSSINPGVKMGTSSLSTGRVTIDHQPQLYSGKSVQSRPQVEETVENLADQSMEMFRHIVDDIDIRKQEWVKAAEQHSLLDSLNDSLREHQDDISAVESQEFQTTTSMDIHEMEKVRNHLQNMLKTSAAVMADKESYDHSRNVESIDELLTAGQHFDHSQALDSSDAMNSTVSSALLAHGFPNMSSLLEQKYSIPSHGWMDTSTDPKPRPGHHHQSDLARFAEVHSLKEALEKERFRRKHCEKQIHLLQSKLLETQEQLAVAVSTDRKKDAMVEQLDKTLARVVGGWKKREAEKQNNIVVLTEENGRLQSLYAQQQQMLQKIERELSTAVDALSNEQQRAAQTEQEMKTKFESLESKHSETQNEVLMLRDHSHRVESELKNLLTENKQLQAKSLVLQETLKQEQEAKSNMETAYRQKMEDITETHLKALRVERSKLEEYEMVSKETQDSLMTSQKEIGELNIQLDTLSREKESLKVEMGLMEARHESSHRRLEAELQAQYERQISEKLEEAHQLQMQSEADLRENFRRQITELNQHHAQDMEYHMERQSEEIRKKEHDFQKQLHQMEQSLAKCREDLQKSREENKKLQAYQGEYSELVSRLPSLMQSHCQDMLRQLTGSAGNSFTLTQVQAASSHYTTSPIRSITTGQATSSQVPIATTSVTFTSPVLDNMVSVSMLNEDSPTMPVRDDNVPCRQQPFKRSAFQSVSSDFNQKRALEYISNLNQQQDHNAYGSGITDQDSGNSTANSGLYPYGNGSESAQGAQYFTNISRPVPAKGPVFPTSSSNQYSVAVNSYPHQPQFSHAGVNHTDKEILSQSAYATGHQQSHGLSEGEKSQMNHTSPAVLLHPQFSQSQLQHYQSHPNDVTQTKPVQYPGILHHQGVTEPMQATVHACDKDGRQRTGNEFMYAQREHDGSGTGQQRTGNEVMYSQRDDRSGMGQQRAQTDFIYAQRDAGSDMGLQRMGNELMYTQRDAGSDMGQQRMGNELMYTQRDVFVPLEETMNDTLSTISYVGESGMGGHGGRAMTHVEASPSHPPDGSLNMADLSITQAQRHTQDGGDGPSQQEMYRSSTSLIHRSYENGDVTQLSMGPIQNVTGPNDQQNPVRDDYDSISSRIEEHQARQTELQYYIKKLLYGGTEDEPGNITSRSDSSQTQEKSRLYLGHSQNQSKPIMDQSDQAPTHDKHRYTEHSVKMSSPLKKSSPKELLEPSKQQPQMPSKNPAFSKMTVKSSQASHLQMPSQAVHAASQRQAGISPKEASEISRLLSQYGKGQILRDEAPSRDQSISAQVMPRKAPQTLHRVENPDIASPPSPPTRPVNRPADRSKVTRNLGAKYMESELTSKQEENMSKGKAGRSSTAPSKKTERKVSAAHKSNASKQSHAPVWR